MARSHADVTRQGNPEFKQLANEAFDRAKKSYGFDHAAKTTQNVGCILRFLTRSQHATCQCCHTAHTTDVLRTTEIDPTDLPDTAAPTAPSEGIRVLLGRCSEE